MRIFDPIIGVWKLNTSKSNFSPILLKALNEAAPKEQIEIYQELGDQIELTRTGEKINGESISGKYTWPRQGGVAIMQEDVPSVAGTTIVETLIAPGEWYATFLKDGKQFIVIQKMVSKDGMSLHQKIIAMDPEGKSIDQIMIYEKQ